MGLVIDLIPESTTATNPFGITFGAGASIEIIDPPIIAVNRDLSNTSLDYVFETGVIIRKGPVTAFIPFSNIKAFLF